MEIIPRQVFRDARSIPAKFSRYDPRSDKFNETEVIINLRDCAGIHPPAVLWCAVYLLLAKSRGCDCLLLSPNDEDVASSLRDMGLIRVLQEENVAVESGGADISGSLDAVLPLTRFDSSTAESLTDQVHISLSTRGQGSANMYPEITETFSELVNNAAEHSESTIDALGLVMFYSSGQNRRFVIGVADGGIGIRQSLERNPAHRNNYGYEWVAIRRATGELVSGTLNSYRGIGLFSTFDESLRSGRELIIHSGTGIITLSENSQARIIRANPFPGTMVCVSISA